MEECGLDSVSSSGLWEDGVVSGGLGQEWSFGGWSGDQGEAAERWLAWMKAGSPGGTWALGGVAGSGKSAMIPWMVRVAGGCGSGGSGPAAVCAYTGKAAVVLRRRGVANAQTLHSFLYDRRAVRDESSGEVRWEWHDRPAPWYSRIRLVVVDEASMVPEEMRRRLESLGMPVVYVGDHAQLPPVSSEDGGSAGGPMDHPDFRMERVLRSREGSAVVALSRTAREEGDIPLGRWGSCRHTTAWNPEEALLEHDVVLCWTNAARRRLNDLARRLRGLPPDTPVRDDRLVAKANCPRLPVFNGQMVYLVRDGLARPDGSWDLEWIDEVVHDDAVAAALGSSVRARCAVALSPEETRRARDLEWLWRKWLSSGRRGPRPDRPRPPYEAYLDWGYAVTVHSAQGSSWPRVAVVAEPGARGREWWPRWLYTAVTRASESVTIYSGPDAGSVPRRLAE